jgi:hypothetical protein
VRRLRTGYSSWWRMVLSTGSFNLPVVTEKKATEGGCGEDSRKQTHSSHVTRLRPASDATRFSKTPKLTRSVILMIIPLTLPPKSSPNGAGPALPPALAQLGSSEFFLLELQGELQVSGDKHGQLVGRLTIDDSNDGKVRMSSHNPSLHIIYCASRRS